MSILQNNEIWVAILSVLSGGTLFRIIQLVANRRRNAIHLAGEEKIDLREDIAYLRGEIESLRRDVKELRSELERTQADLSLWQRRYWNKKVELDKVLIQVQHNADDHLRKKIFEVVATQEEWLENEDEV